MANVSAIELHQSLLWKPHSDSSVWFVAFGGMQLYQPVPDFEWGHAFEALCANHLFVRDPAQYWYIRGLADLAPDLPGTIQALRDRLAAAGCRRLVCVGASTGGYAALLFGAQLGADEVHAFSPMTTIPSRTIPEVAQLVRTANWPLIGRHITLRLSPGLAAAYRDLRPILQADNGRTVYHLYYGRRHPADRRNARHLDGLPRLSLHDYDDYHHDIVRRLRESGELTGLLAAAHARVTATTDPLTHDSLTDPAQSSTPHPPPQSSRSATAKSR